MKKLLLLLLLLIPVVANSQVDMSILPLKDTLIAKTHEYRSRSSDIRQSPFDSTFGIGETTIYDSIVVDTAGGKWNTIFIYHLDTAGGSTDTVIVEGFSKTLLQWTQLSLLNLKTNTVVTLMAAGDDTFTKYQVLDKGVIYLRQRLVNTKNNYIAGRRALTSVEFFLTP